MKKLFSVFIFIVLMVVPFVYAEAAQVLTFYDDFNDNTLDATKWTTDVVSNSATQINAFNETNQEARFQIFGSGNSYLLSDVITIEDWDTITIQGKWKFSANPETPEMVCYIYDADTDEFYAMIHKSWGSKIRYYHSKTNYLEESRAIPEEYVSFKIVITKTKVEFWEGGTKLNEFSTTSLASATNFKLKIGSKESTGWYNRYSYFDDIQITVSVIDAAPASIPTMNEWGMIIFSLILAGSAIWVIRRRQVS